MCMKRATRAWHSLKPRRSAKAERTSRRGPSVGSGVWRWLHGFDDAAQKHKLSLRRQWLLRLSRVKVKVRHCPSPLATYAPPKCNNYYVVAVAEWSSYCIQSDKELMIWVEDKLILIARWLLCRVVLILKYYYRRLQAF